MRIKQVILDRETLVFLFVAFVLFVVHVFALGVAIG
jgi:hypothetical protein